MQAELDDALQLVKSIVGEKAIGVDASIKVKEAARNYNKHYDGVYTRRTLA